MNITVLTGSPHRSGATALLADEFCAGAAQGGHRVTRLDAGELAVQACAGCASCRASGGVCAIDDDMRRITPSIAECDIVALVTPLYYFGMTAQLKSVLDRFCAINPIPA